MMLWVLVIAFALLWTHSIAHCLLGCICRASGSVEEIACHGINLTSIPPDLSSSIVRIDLANNSLEILDLSQLRFFQRPSEVILRENKIHRIVDSSSLSTPIHIQILVLSHNRLRRIDRTLRHLADTLVQLDLSYNLLVDIENEFLDLKHLSRLDLRNNQLTEVTANSFRDLVNLRYLRLEDNHIASISADTFLNLENLSYLVLKGNPIGTFSEQIMFNFSTNYLSYVDLSECELRKMPSGFQSSVRYLQLRKNHLTTLGKEDFLGFVRLEILILDDNKIRDVEDGVFESLKALNQLWMSNNRLKTVPSRLPLSVHRLLMDSNQIEELKQEAFAKLSYLQFLSLMGNSISVIEEQTFSSMPHLSHLDLSANNITRIIPGTFLKNSRLKVLHLSKNPLQSLEQGCFDGLTHLEELTATYVPVRPSTTDNKDFTIDAIGDLQRLSRLDLDGSTELITALSTYGPRLRHTMSRLRDLSLMKSDLVRLSQDFLSYFPELISLRISGDRWRCDRSLLWLRNWLLSNSSAPLEDNRCLTPDHVTGRSVASLEEWEFNTDPEIIDNNEITENYRPPTALVPFTTRSHNHSQLRPLHSTTPASRPNGVSFKENGEIRKTKKAKSHPTPHTTSAGRDDVAQWVDLATKSHLIEGPSPGNISKVNHQETIIAPPTVSIGKIPNNRAMTELELITNGPQMEKEPDHDHKGFTSPAIFRKLATLNWTGSRLHFPGYDSTDSNLTSEFKADDISRASTDLILTTDMIIAMGTIAGTILTAGIMIAAIIHLCCKEKTTIKSQKTTVNSHQNDIKIAATNAQDGRQEIVYLTPDLQKGPGISTDGSRSDVSTMDRTIRNSNGNRVCLRGHESVAACCGRTFPVGQTGSFNGDLNAEFDSLIGQSVSGRSQDTQIRVYKWEDF